jgi:GrpB-like predicted nucleotidyltransferase (UPF0157 family)
VATVLIHIMIRKLTELSRLKIPGNPPYIKILLEARMIEISDYQEDWKIRFIEIRKDLLSALSRITNKVEHVGSTSVEGLCAKPIIDIDVIIKRESDFEPVRSTLSKIGYVYEGDLGIHGREAFRCSPDAIKHNLYVCLEGTVALQNHLTLRDHLRSHSEDRNRYGILKRALAERFNDDIDAYVEGKTDFIIPILSKYGINNLDDIRNDNKKDG